MHGPLAVPGGYDEGWADATHALIDNVRRARARLVDVTVKQEDIRRLDELAARSGLRGWIAS